ncbi:MAG: trypsin-like peptidase domain-containing protein [Clostridia bacterium]|nr:trypsin-like peptidase domain-containing protein [Clostridia bacterium]
MKKIICLLTALCALFLISAVAESGFAQDPKRINEAAESVVILEQKDEEGNVIARASGFAALEPGLVITSASFIEDAGEITATTDAGETLTVSGILGCNTDSDVAIIALEEKEKLAPLSIDAEKRVLRGSDCVVVGAQGENISVSIGNMSGFFEEDDISLIQFTAPLSVGSGGSPLFDENGNVAGVTTGSYYDGTGVVQNLNFAVNITEALKLYEIVKEDEIAAFSEWEITDIGIKSFINPEPPMEFYIENNSNYDITRIYIYKYGTTPVKARIKTGLKRGETATVPITQEEYESKDLWCIRFDLPSWGRVNYDTMAYSVPYLLGRTFELANFTEPIRNRQFMSFVEKEKYIAQRRHLPEDTELLNANTIPYNCIRVINDTGMSMTEFSFSHIGLFRNLVYFPSHPLYSGYDALVFLTDKDITSVDSFFMRAWFYSVRNEPYMPTWTIEPEDILGKTIRFYIDESGEFVYELQ